MCLGRRQLLTKHNPDYFHLSLQLSWCQSNPSTLGGNWLGLAGVRPLVEKFFLGQSSHINKGSFGRKKPLYRIHFAPHSLGMRCVLAKYHCLLGIRNQVWLTWNHWALGGDTIRFAQAIQKSWHSAFNCLETVVQLMEKKALSTE